MLRPALSLPLHRLGQAPWVEQAEPRQNGMDRWLLNAAGKLRVWGSALPRLGLRWFARQVMAQGLVLKDRSEAELKADIAQVSAALRQQGLTPKLTAKAFALVREVAGRQLGKFHYAVQIMGGKVMLDGGIAEMQTGEGKTLTALLPAITMAMAGVPVHVVTVNEYLAERDADLLTPVYAFFGLSVGKVLPDQQPPQRRQAYACDVAYCVNKDVTFDYLRDRIEALAGRLGPQATVNALFKRQSGPAPGVMRGLWFAIVDEADSVFIDEARTPLIISKSSDELGERDRFEAVLALATRLSEGQHFLLKQRERHAVLTEAGRQALAACFDARLPQAIIERERLLDQALTALHCFELDRHYIVAEGKIQIVDEYTGRVMPDRTWEGGLHQLIECKEGVDTTQARSTTARITYQRMFRRYLRVGGMSGTITEVAGELKSALGIDVVRIPTHRQVLRRSLGTRLFVHCALRDQAVVAAAQRETGRGRAVLIGTRSVAASERIARLCMEAGLKPTVLNAKQDVQEAEVIAQAGQPGQLTVATNMAGRGTDIELTQRLKEAGGLHVILTEFHDSTRIDRQLFGRAGRQGDPGSYECLVALDDELFTSHAAQAAQWLGQRHDREVPAFYAPWLRRWAQYTAEAHNADVRRHTVAQERETDRLLAFAGRPE